MLRKIYEKFEARKKFLQAEALKNFSAARIQNAFRTYKKNISVNLATRMVLSKFKDVESDKYAQAKKVGKTQA